LQLEIGQVFGHFSFNLTNFWFIRKMKMMVYNLKSNDSNILLPHHAYQAEETQ